MIDAIGRELFKKLEEEKKPMIIFPIQSETDYKFKGNIHKKTMEVYILDYKETINML